MHIVKAWQNLFPAMNFLILIIAFRLLCDADRSHHWQYVCVYIHICIYMTACSNRGGPAWRGGVTVCVFICVSLLQPVFISSTLQSSSTAWSRWTPITHYRCAPQACRQRGFPTAVSPVPCRIKSAAVVVVADPPRRGSRAPIGPEPAAPDQNPGPILPGLPAEPAEEIFRATRGRVLNGPG